MQQYCYHCMRPLNGATVCPHCGNDNSIITTAASYHLAPGTVLANRYRIGKVLGEGGFGITYIGLDTTLSKRVAVKEFYPSGIVGRTANSSNEVVVVNAKDNFFDKGVDKFLIEAKNVAAFSDEEGIVDVLDYFTENNTAYIVMEYLEGETLKSCLSTRGKFNAAELITLLMPVMRSLQFIHSKGIIHRDISPDNIMYTTKGKLKLMDFGSARYFTNDRRTMSIILKKGYAPEEQYRQSSEQGPYTDIYALCATIYTCITGKTPVNSLDRIVKDNLTPPSQLGVEISAACERALMHGLAPLAKNRPQNMGELMAEFTVKDSADQTIDVNRELPNRLTESDLPQEDEKQAPVFVDPPSPNEYADGLRDSDEAKTKRVAPKPKKHTAVIVAAAALIFAIIAAVAALVLLYIRDQNRQSRLSSQDTTAAEAVPTVATIPETYATIRGLSPDAAKAYTPQLKALFSDRVALVDSEASITDEISLKEIDYCRSSDGEYAGIIFIYQNITGGYYKSLEVRSETIQTENGEILNPGEVAFHENKSGKTLAEATENCWPLSSSFKSFYQSTKLFS